MTKKNTFLGVIILMFCTACSIKGSFQGLYSYYSKTKSQDPQLLIFPDTSTSICEINKSDTPRIVVINGSMLKECIKTNNKAVVYLWAPKCKGEFCYSLNLLQQKCDTKGATLYIVAEYYDTQLMQINYKINKPISGIDVEYYNSNRTSKYLSKFIYDLTLRSDMSGRLIYFEDGVFKKSVDSIEEI
jgi:hypothetical protein